MLVLHEDCDQIILLEQGKILFEKLTPPKRFHCIMGGDHMNFHRLDGAAFFQQVVSFVREIERRKG